MRNPIACAAAVFVDRTGHQDLEHSDTAGNVSARQGFQAVRVRISARGYLAVTSSFTNSLTEVTLRRTLSIVANVRVATGTLENLHSLPVPATALDANAISLSPSTTTDEMLRALPGFDRDRSNSEFTNYGQLRVSFAGAGTDRGLVLVDGVPAQDGFGGQIDWQAYPPSVLTRAELLLGAGSALYGAGAAGGVLNLSTFAPAGDASAPQGRLFVSSGSNGSYSDTINVRAQIAPKLDASLSANTERMQYFDLPPGYQSAVDTAARAQSSMSEVHFRYAPSAQSIFELGALGAWDSQQEGRPNYNFSRSLRQESLRYLLRTAKRQLTMTYFGRTGVVTNVADQYPEHPGSPGYTQDVPTTEHGALLSWTAQGVDSTFEARGEARWISGDTTQLGPTGSFENSGSGNQRLAGLAVQETLRARRLSLLLGARADEASNATVASQDTDAAISPRLAARYDLSKNVALRASIGTGFRPPFLNELLRGYFIGKVDFEPSAGLVPERSRTSSAGVDILGRAQRLSVDLFDTSVANAIAFRTIDATHQIRSNIDRTRTDGATLTYTRAMGACSRITISGTAQNARVTAGPATIIGKHLTYVPSGTATVGFDAQIGDIGAGVNVSYLGQIYADDLNAQPLGTAIVAGVRFSVPLKNAVQLVLSGDNITGTRYLSSVDRYGPPPTVSLGLSVPVGSANARSLVSCK